MNYTKENLVTKEQNAKNELFTIFLHINDNTEYKKNIKTSYRKIEQNKMIPSS